MNFEAPSVELPFKCKTLSVASTKECEVKKADTPADGKYTALFPVSLPDEGTFDWLDSFLEKNKGYTEFSDRAFLDWALKSGQHAKGEKHCNDRLPLPLDDIIAVKKTLLDVAALAP